MEKIKVHWAFNGKVFLENVDAVPKVGQLMRDKDGFRYLITEVREILWHENEYEVAVKPFPILATVNSFEELFEGEV